MSEVTNVVFMGEVPSRRMSRPLDPIPGAGFRKQDRDSSQGCQATQGIAKGQAPRNCQGTGPANCYPDFIAKLPTVKVLAVEYKGLDRSTTDDTREKERLGKLGEERSGGQCYFEMVKGPGELGKIQNVIKRASAG